MGNSELIKKMDEGGGTKEAQGWEAGRLGSLKDGGWDVEKLRG